MVLALPQVCSGEASPPAPATQPQVLFDLHSQRGAAEQAADLAETVRKSVLAAYDHAIRCAEQKLESEKKRNELREQIASAPERIRDFQRKREEAAARPPDHPWWQPLDRETAERRLREGKETLTASQSAASSLRDWMERQRTRPGQARKELAAMQERLDKIQIDSRMPPAADQPALLIEAQKTAWTAETGLLEAQKALLDLEIEGNAVLLALTESQHSWSLQEVATAELAVKGWQEAVQQLREREAAASRLDAESAKRQVRAMPDALRREFDANIALGRRLEALTRNESVLATQLTETQADLKRLTDELLVDRERFASAEVTETIGLAWRQRRQSLPKASDYRKRSQALQAIIATCRDEQFAVDRDLLVMKDREQALSRMAANLGLADPQELAVLGQVLDARQDLFARLRVNLQRSFQSSQDLEFAQQQLAAKAREYKDFLDGRLLWIRSARGLFSERPAQFVATIAWMTQAQTWLPTGRDFWISLTSSPVWWTLGLLLLGAAFSLRRWFIRDLARMADRVRDRRRADLLTSVRALILTLVLAAMFPLTLGFLAWRLASLGVASEVSYALGQALWDCCRLWCLLLLTAWICRDGGLADAHFGWPEKIRRLLRASLAWFTPVAITLQFCCTFIEQAGQPGDADTIGRSAFILLMLASAAFMTWLLRAQGGLLSELDPERWTYRLRYLWSGLIVATPLGLGLLSGTGYRHTAQEIAVQLRNGLWLIMVLVLAHEIAIRWLVVTKRRLAIAEATRRRAAANDQSVVPADPGAGGEGVPLPQPERRLRLSAMDEQTRRLLRTSLVLALAVGLWAICSPVLPALKVLDEITLWTHNVQVDGVVKTMPVTVAGLILSMIMLVVTVVASGNLPGVADTVILGRLGLESGVRHAASTLFRYALFITGVIAALSILGISWSNVQWLVAALSVGLGFGLQEIVANFVSGIIVLIERPFRVGDVVTVGETTGTVTCINIRATTITDWDRRESIIPNRDFITGTVVNWSLSDQITRLTIQVGVAYGSDVDLVERVLLEIAAREPSVLAEPAPTALFMAFGESALNFELRVFVRSIAERLGAMDAIHRAVDREFRAAGVVVAFPQRDVHFDPAGPLQVRLMRPESGTTAQADTAPRRSIDPGRSGTADATAVARRKRDALASSDDAGAIAPP